MNDDSDRVLRNLQAALERADKEAKTAHAHAEAFEAFLRAEVETAKKAGACSDCVMKALIAVMCDLMAEGMPDDPRVAIVNIKTSYDRWEASILGAYMRRMARQMSEKAAKT